jgi:glycogenin glucosyltransferase
MSTAWVTLATNDGYALGALVLAHSLKRAQTKHHLHILYTSGVSDQMRSRLLAVFHNSTKVDILDSKDTENLALIERPDLGVTFTKLHCWRLTQYEKCVFLDADTLCIQNCDELFERPEFAAAPDIGWPDLFNSGVFVFVPSNETYHKLLEFGTTHGTFDGGDQGLLNLYFSNWREMDASHRLPFIYNVTSGSIYSYKAAYQLFGGQVKIVHFLGTVKPWHRSGQKHGHQNDHWGYWQQIFNENVVQNLPKGLKEGTSEDDKRAAEEARYTAWDQGAPDYEGRDAFSFIKKQIESVLHEALPEAVTEPLRPEEPLPSPEPDVHNVVTESIIPAAIPPHGDEAAPALPAADQQQSEQQQQSSEEQHHQQQPEEQHQQQ